MGLRSWWQGLRAEPEVLERAPAQPKLPERTGYEFGIGPGGLTETNQGLGAGTMQPRGER